MHHERQLICTFAVDGYNLIQALFFSDPEKIPYEDVAFLPFLSSESESSDSELSVTDMYGKFFSHSA